MDGFLIKVEVQENANFHCIICKAEFLNRSDRNEHLETHFIHRSCKNCSRPVIVIGDLEFELHHPTYCEQSEAKSEEIFEQCDIGDNVILSQDRPKDEEDCLESKRMTNRTRNDVNYTEKTDDEERIVDEEKPIRRTRRKPKKRISKREQVNIVNEYELNVDTDLVGSTYLSCKMESDIEDVVVKEMDVALKKRRRQYAKLPKTVPCTVSKCDAMFGTERTLKIHMNQVHGIKERYICPICSREFKIGGNLKQHIETHSDYKRFICNYCGKGFHLPYNLKEHMNTHTGARPYECQTCGKSFGRNTLRQAHMRIHTGEKPYKCTEENCDRAYAYQTDLKRHRRSVHGIITKTFPCPICSKVFYENKFLTKHLNVHQGSA